MEDRKVVVYSSKNDSLKVSLRKVWEYSALVWVFAKRDIKVKYAQTIFGFGWSIFKPLLGLLIYVFFFGLVLNWNTGSIPFPLYVLTGLIGWNLFTYIVSNGVSSVQESNDLIKKIYFPKSILPLSKTVVGLIEASISFLLLIPLLIYYEQPIVGKIAFFPIVLLFNVVCGLSLVFFISSLAIVKRDLLQVIPFLLNMAVWFTPVFFSIDILPEDFQFLMIYNPIANMIDLWRWVFFENIAFQLVWGVNFLIMSLFLVVSFYYYTLKENKITDFA